MGYNTPVLIYNDRFHEIKEDKDLGKKLYKASIDATFSVQKQVEGVTYADSIPGVGVMLSSEHADAVRCIVVGRNSMVEIGTRFGKFPLDNESTVEYLNEIASIYGYRLVKEKGR